MDKVAVVAERVGGQRKGRAGARALWSREHGEFQDLNRTEEEAWEDRRL